MLTGPLGQLILAFLAEQAKGKGGLLGGPRPSAIPDMAGIINTARTPATGGPYTYNSANQNPYAAQALSQGRGSYVNPADNMLMPTMAPSGNPRNTYGDD